MIWASSSGRLMAPSLDSLKLFERAALKKADLAHRMALWG